MLLLELDQLSLPLGDVSELDLWQGQLWVELEMLRATQTALSEVEQKLDVLALADKQVQLLQTIPGVGRRLAEAVVTCLDNPHRFRTGKQVGSYAGLMTPRQYQSGQQNRQGRISRQGNTLLRGLLVEVSWLMLRWNDWARRTYQRVRRGSDALSKIAVTAVARQLLIRCWAMLRDNTPWQAPAELPRDKENWEHELKRKRAKYKDFFSPPENTGVVLGR